jgi:flavin-binding protein dodecin
MLSFYKVSLTCLTLYRERRGDIMSVYKIVEIIGTSPKSWEDAAQTALKTSSKSLEDLRIAEVVKQDVTVENGKITSFRVRLNISFKYKGGL